MTAMVNAAASGSIDTATSLPVEEQELLRELRRGDERAFRAIIDRYHGALVRYAMTYVRDRSLAEEVAQETWLGVIRGLDGFQARSSLKTWLFRIAANIAKTRARREWRSVAFSALSPASEEGDPAVHPGRFIEPGDPHLPGHWASPPASWDEIPEDHLLAVDTLARVKEAIARLPASQRQVITLRDIEGWSSEEVCSLLEISVANQRVLLHRARSRVRAALEKYLAAS